jgi:hypothetical protein
MFLSTICDNLLELSTHPYGCRVLQRCLEHLPEEHTISLLQAVHHFTIDLMQDQYGVSLLVPRRQLLILRNIIELRDSVYNSARKVSGQESCYL